jgi:uncharacterized protein YgiM (DUF1202 family)
MRIIDPVLAPDVSDWCDHINPREFEDAGCASVVVGLYPTLDNSGNKVLSARSRQHCVDVATKSSMVLQAYFWDDIILDPLKQADWVVQTLRKEGLPIKWIWIDQEQWWTDWTAWQKARGGLIPMSSVPTASPAAISMHCESFNRRLHSQIPQNGVYTNNGFVSSWAPGMDNWLSQYYAWVPHYGRQPKEVTRMSWATFKENWLPNYEIVLSPGQKPAQVMGHQFTGDACILPGSYNQFGGSLPLDVNVFSKAFIDSIRASDLTGVLIPEPTPAPTPPPPAGTKEYVVQYARVNVRAAPSGSATWVRYAVKDEVLYVVKIENDWAQLYDNTYIFAAYISPAPSSTPIPAPDPDPAPAPTPTPTPTPPAGTEEYVVVNTRVNVRAAPSGSAAWVRYAEKDEVLYVVKIENGWAQLYDNTYIFAAYIAPVPSSAPDPTPTPTPAPTPTAGTEDYVVLYTRINVRTQPSSSSTWVRFAVKDEVLHVVKIENSWAQLADGTYVYADYIRKA